jgi:hypothetical protein
MPLGPVEYIVVGFPGNKFKGDIAPALADLVSSGTIRVMDLAFVSKDEDGNVLAFELEDLAEDEASPFAEFEKQISDLLNAEDLAFIADSLDPGSSAAVLVWENLWAARFAETMREADAVLVAYDRIPYDTIRAAMEYADSGS